MFDSLQNRMKYGPDHDIPDIDGPDIVRYQGCPDLYGDIRSPSFVVYERLVP